MLNKTFIKTSSLALALSLSPAILANTLADTGDELISNGSFENFTVSKDNGSWKLVQFDQWQGDGEVWTNKLGKAATDGEHKIELDVGRELNTLSQGVATVAGQKYHLSLDAYARTAKSSDFEILVDGEVIATIKPYRKWQRYDAYFIGTGSTQTISIKEIEAQNNGLGTIIDNISLKANNELLSNGSFEEFTVNADHGSWKEVTFKDWQGKGEVWNHRLGKKATAGAYKIELDVGREENSLSQTVQTEEGLYYELSVDAYARKTNSSDFEIWLDNEKLETISPSKNWQRYTVKILGNGTNQNIILKELNSQNNSLGTIIDNISLISTGEYKNSVPIISGTPLTNISTGDSYSFTPIASDENTDDTLTFSIKNKPDWANFNESTGTLSGTPSTESISNNIMISVSDNSKTASLPAFAIKVKDAVNVARQFGIATQAPRNGYYYYADPSKVLDGDSSTFNHTQCSAGENWWQVALPQPTHIAKFMIQGRNGNTGRLDGAEVYITSTPYNGTLNANDKVATLVGSAAQQETVFDTKKSGNYLIVKASGSHCLHLAEVEVYGAMPETPVFASHQTDFLVQSSVAVGETLASLPASDYQGDDLSYRIIGDVPFAIDAQGNITVSQALEAGNYQVLVEVSDGNYSSQSTLSVNVTSNTAVDDAIRSGDVSQVTEQELISATLNEIEATKNLLLEAKKKIFNLNLDGSEKDDGSSLTSIDWDPTHDASLLIPTLGVNVGLLETNAVTKSSKTIYKKDIAIMGKKGAGRYLVFGANPLRNNVNEQMNQVLENSLAWLTGRDNLKTAPFNVVISHLDQSYWFRDEDKTRQWLDTHYAGKIQYNAENACDNNALAECLTSSTDLLIISQVSAENDDIEAITATVNQALKNGTAVLYLHHDGNHKTLGKALFSSVFDVTYQWDNYRKKLQLQAYNPLEGINQLPDSLAKIKTLFTHFQNTDYNFNWEQCNNGKGSFGSKYDGCNDVTGLSSEFQSGASTVKAMLDSFDKSKKNIFNSDNYRVQKLFALTADKFRQGISYPMDKATSDDNVFMKSYYADHAVYNYRTINPAQADMGNFSRSNFSHITPVTKTVNLTSKKSFRSTGAYALPGQTVSVTRHDHSDLTVKVFINTLRSDATHQYQKNGYKRPKYLKTPYFEIKSGETIQLTSPYGGPLQLQFGANDLPVSVTFANVGEHAYWAGSADDASFTTKLDAGEYDWAEVVTAGFEVHSKLDKMRTSIARPEWGTAQALANATERYMSNLPHLLAGFKGTGIDVVDEIHNFATINNLTIETLDKVKHMNADQATCGYGCSGNPYDAYWAYSPIGHGDVHELGHGLEKSRFRFEGWEGHSTTNPYAYYTQSNYNQTSGSETVCQNLPFKQVFEKLQASTSASNATDYLKTNLWATSNWSQQFMVTLQAMMHTQKMGKLDNGWHLLSRLHILEREAKRAKQNWESSKATIGFSNYSLTEFNSIRNNDWLLVSLSFASGLDFSDYLDMMGIEYSAKAATQVASFNNPMVAKEFFVSTPNGYCKTDTYGDYLNKSTLAIDGNAVWPE